MREISVKDIKRVISRLCIESNTKLRKDILGALKKALKKETRRVARGILSDIIENARIASQEKLAICQDTGMAVVFLEIGQNLKIVGGSLNKAVNDGVRDGYKKGYLRKSVVADPLLRKNTKTNTPCIVHTDIVSGNKLKITVAPKGFGSENKSQVKMFNPTAGISDIKEFILKVVKEAGPAACPPLVVGIGIGGTIDKAAELSKHALLRPINKSNPKSHIRNLEKELLHNINKLGIGPMGLGGKTTALGVSILTYPTHIAGLPVAVNISCHATRSASSAL